MNSGLYVGRVTHTRLRPVHHHFEYRVFYGLFDIDELPQLGRSLRLFSFEGRNLVSLRSRDHGPDDGSDLRTWATRRLDDAGVDIEGGPIRLLAFPRVLGYVFNPISVWYCHGPGGELRAIMHEVRNTFGDKHTYVVPVDGDDTRHGFDKRLHVSPFMDMDSRYEFAMNVPGERLALGIRQHDDDGELFRAGLRGERRPFSDKELAKLLVTHPFVTLKAVAAIHLQAVRLWRKRVPFHRRPEPAEVPHSVVDRTSA